MKSNHLFRQFLPLVILTMLAVSLQPVKAANIRLVDIPPATDAIGLVASANYQADNLTLDDQYLYPDLQFDQCGRSESRNR